MKALSRLRVAILLLAGFFLASIAFLWSPDPVCDRARRSVSTALNAHFDRMLDRARSGRSTTLDRLTLRSVYGGMNLVGRIIYPEAAAILSHYLDGRTDDLLLDAAYFRRSPVVRRALESKACGRIGPVSLLVRDDPRLAYALNPFFLEVHCEQGRRDIDLWQVIQFAPLKGRGRVITPFRLGRLELRLDDSLIHVFDGEGACLPFTVHARWSE